MSHYSSEALDRHGEWLRANAIKVRAACFERSAYVSKRDGCLVVLVDCDSCGKQFEERLLEAKGKVLACEDILCLKCDGDAVVPAFRGITIQCSWFLG